MRGHVRQRNAAQQRAPDTYSYAPILDSGFERTGVETGWDRESLIFQRFLERRTIDLFSKWFYSGKEDRESFWFFRILLEIGWSILVIDVELERIRKIGLLFDLGGSI